VPFYRVYHYRNRSREFRHIYFTRERNSRLGDTASVNVAAILAKLAEKEKSEDEKGLENLSRARRNIRDYILCNPFEYFCTFTFNGAVVERFDYKACKKKITKVFDNYKNHYSSGFRYIIVPEFHKNGGIHFHGMVRGIRSQDLIVPKMIYKRNHSTGELYMVPNTRGYVDWPYYSQKLGFFSCSLVKNYEKCAVYVSKYITKNLINMELGQRVFMASQHLLKPELVFDEDNIPLVDEPDFANEFVRIKDSRDNYGLLPDWFGECCSDLRDAPEEQAEPLNERDIFFPRLTGKQLSLMM
jgi:hypothetical protein